MPRQIEFLRSRFVPDLERCDAVDNDMRCENGAVLFARVDGTEHPVCHFHLTLLCKEKWPIQWKP
jgi:hypothetical protein